MRDPKRIPLILDELKGIWGAFPDLRLGQLISNVIGTQMLGDSIEVEQKFYYIEDEELINHFRNYLSEVKYIEPNKPNIQNKE
jgi:hypothetical protein